VRSRDRDQVWQAADFDNYNLPGTLRELVDVLNERFVAVDGTRILDFQFKSMTPYEKALETPSEACLELVRSGQGDANLGTWAPDIRELFNNCADSRETDRAIVDPDAVNVYIFDATSYELTVPDRDRVPDCDSSVSVGGQIIRDIMVKDSEDWTSNGAFNVGRPFLRIDYERINDGGEWGLRAVFEHEMGHAFLLRHVCNDVDADGDGIEDGDLSTPSNIMSSSLAGFEMRFVDFDSKVGASTATGDRFEKDARSYGEWIETETCDPDTRYTRDRGMGFAAWQVDRILETADRLDFVR
jgi:hypothetical protein